MEKNNYDFYIIKKTIDNEQLYELFTSKIEVGDKIILNKFWVDIEVIEKLNENNFKLDFDGDGSIVSATKNQISKFIGFLSMENINEGDKVVVEFTNGFEQIGELLIGILTKKCDDEPICFIDNKVVYLSSEGYSSNIYKIVNEKLI